jgi:hypothetical protein
MGSRISCAGGRGSLYSEPLSIRGLFLLRCIRRGSRERRGERLAIKMRMGDRAANPEPHPSPTRSLGRNRTARSLPREQVISRTTLRTGNDVRANTTITGSEKFPSVAALADSGHVTMWGSFDQDSSNWGAYVQHYDAYSSPRELHSAVKTFALNFAWADGE